jgi:uncharacterized membrane protein YfcA
MALPLLLTFGILSGVTSFLSGIFGMAGGLLLMGGLLMMVSVPNAMILHGITQMTSNGWRAILWRKRIDWRIFFRYSLGLAVSSTLFSGIDFVVDKDVATILLGLMPFVSFVVPPNLVPQAGRRGGAEICGFVSTTVQFLAGVSGPTLDVFFVKAQMDRRIVVATKAACQVITHLTKLIYFGFIVGGSSSEIFKVEVIGLAVITAILGTSASRYILESLTDQNFRRYTQWILMVTGTVYLIQGTAGLLAQG